MKTKVIIFAGAAAVACLATQTVCGEDFFAAAEAASKITRGPVLASPHGLEEFPGLTLQLASQSKIRAQGNLIPESVKSNSALVNSPRIREDYPALSRVAQPAKTGESVALARIRQNAALANSPRVREEFPELQLKDSLPAKTNVLASAP